MKQLSSLTTLLVFLTACQSISPGRFNTHFSGGTLRIDYFHRGDAEEESVKIDRLYRYERWAGSKTNLIDTLNYGAYRTKIRDRSSGKLIYSRGFDSLFKEYQTTTPALEGQSREFHETAMIPMPNQPIVFSLEKRNKKGKWNRIFHDTLNPARAEKAPADSSITVYSLVDNGDASVKADIAIIGDGYTKAEKPRFERDLKRFTNNLFDYEPMRSAKSRFNVRGVFKPSAQSGIDEPGRDIYRQTAVGSSFNTLGSGRYILTQNNRALRNVAGQAPYDALCIMVNSPRYGGGGIYNLLCTFTNGHRESEYVMIHEFGHSFFGFADEYYSSSTAYNDFYPEGKEPSEPNITALQNPDSLKWRKLVSPGIRLPTPWRKAHFDSLNNRWQRRGQELNDRINSLEQSGARQAKIARLKNRADSLKKASTRFKQRFFEESSYLGKVGAFEGAGYASTGLYRPALNCIMFSRAEEFCPVCRRAMRKMIEWYSR